MKKAFVAILAFLAVAALAAAGLYVFQKGKKPEAGYRTERVTRGGIQAVVTATGTVNAVTTVLVGTQVSGTIKTLEADFNSLVTPGQLLAQIDPASFEAQVDQARANLRLAEANAQKSEASLADAKRTWERNRQLFAQDFLARSDLDAAETAHLTAEAQIASNRAQVEQARAALRLAETNLRYTRILSPVHGIVISRNVDVGQTVAASFQTPTLFTIAQDLTNMQVNTSVDEADIGRVRVGQAVEFTVDAYPDQTFTGRVSEIRNAPITVQNVVTYDTIVRVRNPERKLKPGMTANVSIVVKKKNDALRVPNAAFRVKMPSSNHAEDRLHPRGQGVWVVRGQRPVWIPVQPGIADAYFTEVASARLREGDSVVVDAAGRTDRNQRGMGPGFFR